MNALNKIEASSEVLKDCRPDLLARGQEGLTAFIEGLEPLRRALADLTTNGDRETAGQASKLSKQLDALAPSVTMIGQIKSGKTTLVNSMIGSPNLLPADVNPWTSVVTSLHVSPKGTTNGDRARFRFFEQGEWDSLVSSGGRIGELAQRSGADSELVKIKEQVEMMRAKSKARLGRKFEVLLGQEQNYGYFDKDLIERYVCLGDDFETEDGGYDAQGKFADITKSADLYMESSAFPMSLCVRDTPGVNDTFLMREQITIQSIRESRICVVVLSAHQALSSTDMALIRLISNIKSREVIIYVNRIDELPDPKNQVEEIRTSIMDTLAKHKGPTDAQLIFGSALWANYLLRGSVDDLPEDSRKAVSNWAQVADIPGDLDPNSDVFVWELSGVPALFRAISDRIISGVGQQTIRQISASAINLVNGMLASETLAKSRADGLGSAVLDTDEIDARFRALDVVTMQRTETEIDTILSGFSERLDRIHGNFLERATVSLIQHLEHYGEHSVWHYDPTGLRVLLSSSYKSLGNRIQKTFAASATETASAIGALYQDAFGVQGDMFDIKISDAPRILPPVSLGRTIILDVKGSWWKSWWFRRRGYQAYAESFYKLIKEETDGFIDELRVEQAQVIRSDALAAMQTFLDEQKSILMNLNDKSRGNVSAQSRGAHSSEHRVAALTQSIAALQEYQHDE